MCSSKERKCIKHNIYAYINNKIVHKDPVYKHKQHESIFHEGVTRLKPVVPRN